MTIYEILILVIMSGGLIVALWQANTAVKNQKANHERIKKQSTIEYINQLRSAYRTLNHELIKNIGADPIGEEKYNELINDADMFEKLKQLLGMFEHLSLGVRTGVYDFDMVDLMSGEYICGVFRRWRYYIDKRRALENGKNRYVEFQWLVNKIESSRQNPNKKADIRLS
ncbi:MAG: DUF4760 domain-containing protein [Desulfuromonadales bacterium]|nr:DUF4760 domain-containing protein [Desulfuromonadales bacterium]